MARRDCLLSQEPCVCCSAVGIVCLEQSTTVRKPGLPGGTLEEAAQLLRGIAGRGWEQACERASPLSLAWIGCCLGSRSSRGSNKPLILLCTEKAEEPEVDRELTAALGVTNDLLFCALGLREVEDEASAPEASPGLS